MAGEELGPLHGVPSAIKDLFDFKPGWPATWAAFARSSTHVVNVLLRFLRTYGGPGGGAVFLGKTNSSSWDSAAPVTITGSGLRVTHSILRRTVAAPLAAARRRWPMDCCLSPRVATPAALSGFPPRGVACTDTKLHSARVPFCVRPNAFGAADSPSFRRADHPYRGGRSDRAQRARRLAHSSDFHQSAPPGLIPMILA